MVIANISKEGLSYFKYERGSKSVNDLIDSVLYKSLTE